MFTLLLAALNKCQHICKSFSNKQVSRVHANPPLPLHTITLGRL